MERRCFLTGITGNLGSVLADRLIREGWIVHGMIRRASTINEARIRHLYRHPSDPEARMFLHYGDVTDAHSIRAGLERAQPELVVNCAAQSHVAVSFLMPEYTVQATGIGAQNVFEAAAVVCPSAKVVQLSSSEMFGESPASQREDTPFRPVSPYGRAKVLAHHAAVSARRDRGLDVRCAVCFNFEGPERGATFVTRKVTRGAARIAAGLEDKLYLGNPDAIRDWGWVGDAADAVLRVAFAERPSEWCVATGEEHDVRELVEIVFRRFNLSIEEHIIWNDPRQLRPVEVPHLRGDASKIREELGWRPTKMFAEIVELMCAHDERLARIDKYARDCPEGT